jgi:uncharacterized C2H2 Zn-finger protein
MTSLRCNRCGARLSYEEYRDHDCRDENDDPAVDRGEGIVADGLGAVPDGVSTDAATCPTCDDTFKNRHGMRIHHTTVHDESLVEREPTTCEHCAETFTPSQGARGRFCSRECWRAASTNRVDLECATCGEAFKVPGHQADERDYCSRECYWASLADTEIIACAGCGRTIEVGAHYELDHCSRACMAERRTSAPRPDDLDGLLWVLYVYEDNNARETWLRTNAARPDDAAWLTQADVTDRLRENRWMVGGGTPKYADLTIEDVGLDPVDDEGGVDAWQKHYHRAGGDGDGD